MNVGKLKKLLEGLPDDTIILGPGEDHSYRTVDVQLTSVAEYVNKPKRGDPAYSEWYGNHDDFEEKVKVVKAIVVS